MLCQLFSTILFRLLIIPLAHYSQHLLGSRTQMWCPVAGISTSEGSIGDWLVVSGVLSSAIWIFVSPIHWRLMLSAPTQPSTHNMISHLYTNCCCLHHCIAEDLTNYFIVLLVSGLLHLDDCPGQPLLPAWHMVAGSTGLVVPLLYLLFDDLNPALAKQVPASY